MVKLRLRPILLAGVAMLILLQIILFSPSSVEEEGTKSGIDPEVFIPENDRTLATGIPKNKVPDYTVERFSYISTQGTEKEWKLDSDEADLFNHEKLVHSKIIKALLYDSQGKITVVTGKEAKYIMGNRDLEIFGAVKTVFPDGFELTSEYLHYRPMEKSIHIPASYPVKGRGEKLSFDSQGLQFQMTQGRIVLPESCRVFSQSPTQEKTTVTSDRCVILRKEQIAHFSMHSKRPVASRFVEIQQPSLLVRARRADLNYGDPIRLLNYIIAYEDVLIKEIPQNSSQKTLKYGTSGQASFDTQRNTITLTEFPQVYHDDDTVTGDVIILHRDTDIVEVEHSNAFSQGQH